ncbi:MarR family winged helix-turn-helix transcriptional regulator [Chelativorans alearense]|uniref:MarR family winged helix-turn-helix transcriptional regulator n=1 Tax=Chelativorans alearense TaxID=2681495 RepID=UPI0013D0341F|nr:MarR family transcriptional regulator [Chelativorans alearense]
MNKQQRLPWENPRFRNWIAVVRAEKAVVRALSQALAPLGLKIAQLDVLMNLYRHPGTSQHELARRLLVGRSNITMLLPQLEQQNLLRREGDAKDKRIMRLYLTDEGEALLMKALDVYMALIDRAMAQSSPELCDAMGEQMRRIADELEGE